MATTYSKGQSIGSLFNSPLIVEVPLTPANSKVVTQVVTARDGKPGFIFRGKAVMLAAKPALLAKVPAGSILTPHPGEFKRLVGDWQNDFDKLEKLSALAQKINSVVVLKGAYSAVALADGSIYFNSTGNPGMATGGSGDVLTGILTALLAQGYSAPDAALIGVYVHGLAGDLAAREIGETSLIAGDLVNYLPAAFKRLV